MSLLPHQTPPKKNTKTLPHIEHFWGAEEEKYLDLGNNPRKENRYDRYENTKFIFSEQRRNQICPRKFQVFDSFPEIQIGNKKILVERKMQPKDSMDEMKTEAGRRHKGGGEPSGLSVTGKV